MVASHEGSNDGTAATTPLYYVEGSMIELHINHNSVLFGRISRTSTKKDDGLTMNGGTTYQPSIPYDDVVVVEGGP